MITRVGLRAARRATVAILVLPVLTLGRSSFDLCGGGGLAATVRDMAFFTRALLTGHVFRTPETLSHMTETRVAPDQDDYGLGVSAVEHAGVRGWGHNGFWNTFSYHYSDLDATIAGSVMQRQAFDVSDVLLSEAIAAIRD